MTDGLDGLASGNNGSITTTTDLTDLTFMLNFDALWVDQRGPTVASGGLLNATEISNIATFIATGRPVVLMGANFNWASWNDQIMSIVGGAYDGDAESVFALPIESHQLTDGVENIFLSFAGIAVGGTPLFDVNTATLWGDNVLTVLDVFMFSDTGQTQTASDNEVFANNVALWISGYIPPSGAPDISVNPLSLGFGDLPVGGHTQMDVTVTNQGDTDLQIGNVGVIDGLAPPFSFGADTCFGSVVPALNDCVITVMFQPTVTGAFADSFNILSNDPATPDVTVQVAGAGIVAPGIGGHATGLSIKTVNCKNRTTKERVSIRIDGGSSIWDCELAGLVVNPGDKIDMTIKGAAD
jgi:hypothetical protein